MTKIKKIADVPLMSDEKLEKFWENNQPEDFTGWQDGKLNFKRPPKKLNRSSPKNKLEG